MKSIDVSVLTLIFQAVGFLVTICLGYGGFVALRKDVEHQTKDTAETLKRIEENQRQHAADDKEQFGELRLVMKADQAAAANIHAALRETQWELSNLQKWRDRMESRNGPGSQPGTGV